MDDSIKLNALENPDKKFTLCIYHTFVARQFTINHVLFCPKQ